MGNVPREKYDWTFSFFVLFLFKPHPRIYSLILRGGERERERGKKGGREGERGIDVREKHWLVSSHTCFDLDWTCNLGMCPDQGTNPQLFGVWDDVSTMSHPARATFSFFEIKNVWPDDFFFLNQKWADKLGSWNFIQEQETTYLLPLPHPPVKSLKEIVKTKTNWIFCFYNRKFQKHSPKKGKEYNELPYMHHAVIVKSGPVSLQLYCLSAVLSPFPFLTHGITLKHIQHLHFLSIGRKIQRLGQVQVQLPGETMSWVMCALW